MLSEITQFVVGFCAAHAVGLLVVCSIVGFFGLITVTAVEVSIGLSGIEYNMPHKSLFVSTSAILLCTGFCGLVGMWLDYGKAGCLVGAAVALALCAWNYWDTHRRYPLQAPSMKGSTDRAFTS